MKGSILFKKYLFVFLSFLAVSCNGGYYYPGFDFDNFEGTQNEELAYAVEEDNASEIKRLVKENKLNVDFQEQRYGTSLLMLAVVNRKTNAVRALLELGSNPNLVSNSNESSVFMCCKYTSKGDCNLEILELLLQFDGDPNQIAIDPDSGNRYSPINEAVLADCIESIDLLLAYGGDINLYTFYEGYGAITESIVNDRLHITKYLIVDKKAKVPPVCKIFSDGDSMNVIEYLQFQDYNPKEDKENYDLRKEIIEYIKINVDSLGNHKN